MPKERSKNIHGQYFTPVNVARLMVGMTSAPTTARVLEPGFGQGVFLDVLYEHGFQEVHGVEIDPKLAEHPHATVHNQSFLAFDPRFNFDVVIGNPPYIRWKDLSDDAKREMQDHPLFGELFNSLSDYLTAFIAGSIRLLEDGGELIFITPSFWMHTLHSRALREWLLTQGSVTDVVDFGEAEVFRGVASAIVIFRFVRGLSTPDGIRHFRYVGPRRVPATPLELTDPDLFDSRLIEPFSPGAHWTLATKEELQDAVQLESACMRARQDLIGDEAIARLGDYVRIANGMVSGLDRAFQIPPEVVTELNDEEKAATLLVAKAHQLGGLVCSRTTPYIDIPSGLSEDEVRDRYPTLLALLLPYRDQLERRYSYGRNLPFWEWAFRRSEGFFADGTQKALIPCKERITSRPKIRVSMAMKDVVAVQDVTAFAPLPTTRESLEFMVAFMNHPWVSEWVRRRGLLKGGVAEFSEKPLADVPFFPIDWEDETQVGLHNRVTELVSGLWLLGPDEEAKQFAESQIIDELSLLLTKR